MHTIPTITNDQQQQQKREKKEAKRNFDKQQCDYNRKTKEYRGKWRQKQKEKGHILMTQCYLTFEMKRDMDNELININGPQLHCT